MEEIFASEKSDDVVATPFTFTGPLPPDHTVAPVPTAVAPSALASFLLPNALLLIPDAAL